MRSLDAFLAELGDALPVAVFDPFSREGVGVTDVTLELPVESRIGPNAELSLSPPRGRLATGFDPHHGRLRLHFVRGKS